MTWSPSPNSTDRAEAIRVRRFRPSCFLDKVGCIMKTHPADLRRRLCRSAQIRRVHSILLMVWQLFALRGYSDRF